MGLSEGMVRISIGIDNDINRTFEKMKNCMKNLESLNFILTTKKTIK